MASVVATSRSLPSRSSCRTCIREWATSGSSTRTPVIINTVASGPSSPSVPKSSFVRRSGATSSRLPCGSKAIPARSPASVFRSNAGEAVEPNPRSAQARPRASSRSLGNTLNARISAATSRISSGARTATGGRSNDSPLSLVTSEAIFRTASNNSRSAPVAVTASRTASANGVNDFNAIPEPR